MMKKGILIALFIVLVGLLAFVVSSRKPVTISQEATSNIEETPIIEKAEKEAAAAPIPVETPAPVPTPTWMQGTVLAYDVGILYRIAERGETAVILGEVGNYYRIGLENKTLFIEKRFIKDVTEAIPEEKTAYMRLEAGIFASPYLTGEPLEVLKLNSQVTVIEEFGDLMLVQTEAVQGYADASKVSPVRITWSGGGGGSSGGGGNDGGDISLGSRSFLYPVAGLYPVRLEEEKTKDLPEQGRILADGAELYLQIVTAGEYVKVIATEEKHCTIWTGEENGTLPRWAISLEGDEPFREWTGFAKDGAKLFEDYRLAGAGEELKLNTQITVLLQTDEGYYVEANGKQGYIKADDVSEKQIVWSGGGGNSSGGGEWTAPVL